MRSSSLVKQSPYPRLHRTGVPEEHHLQCVLPYAVWSTDLLMQAHCISRQVKRKRTSLRLRRSFAVTRDSHNMCRGQVDPWCLRAVSTLECALQCSAASFRQSSYLPDECLLALLQFNHRAGTDVLGHYSFRPASEPVLGVYKHCIWHGIRWTAANQLTSRKANNHTGLRLT